MGKQMHLIFVGALLLLSNESHAGQLDRDGILRNDAGEIQFMTQSQAAASCPSGSYLPTVRNLAKISQSLGAKGILEATEVIGQTPAGYSFVDATDLNGNRDQFYFSYLGYDVSKSPLRGNWFWSASNYKNGTIVIAAFVLNGLSGDVAFVSSNAVGAVICLKEQP